MCPRSKFVDGCARFENELVSCSLAGDPDDVGTQPREARGSSALGAPIPQGGGGSGSTGVALHPGATPGAFLPYLFLRPGSSPYRQGGGGSATRRRGAAR